MPTGGGIDGSTGRCVASSGGRLGASGEPAGGESVEDEGAEDGATDGVRGEPRAGGRLLRGPIDAATSMAMNSRAPTRRATSTDERARETDIRRTVARVSACRLRAEGPGADRVPPRAGRPASRGWTPPV